MAGLGIFFSVVLAVANKRLKVEEDPKVQKVEDALPGLNCAVCGFPNCRALAEAMAKGEIPSATCPVGGEDAAKLIAGILGLEAEKITKTTAVVHCGADESQRKKKAEYVGIQTCGAANIVFWGGLVALIVWGISRLGRRNESPIKHDALDIAKERYAKGEISKEEFKQLRKELF